MTISVLKAETHNPPPTPAASLISHLAPKSLAASFYPLGNRLKNLVRKMTPLKRKNLKNNNIRASPSEIAQQNIL